MLCTSAYGFYIKCLIYFHRKKLCEQYKEECQQLEIDKSADFNSMCTNTSTCLVKKMKFVSQIVLECGRILYIEECQVQNCK